MRFICLNVNYESIQQTIQVWFDSGTSLSTPILPSFIQQDGPWQSQSEKTHWFNIEMNMIRILPLQISNNIVYLLMSFFVNRNYILIMNMAFMSQCLHKKHMPNIIHGSMVLMQQRILIINIRSNCKVHIMKPQMFKSEHI